MDGDIGFKNAQFQYPTRPEVNVLRDLNLALSQGQKVALVGPSGCGKSTCIQLLQRLYDLKAGDIVSVKLKSFNHLMIDGNMKIRFLCS